MKHIDIVAGLLQKNSHSFHNVVPFDRTKDRLLQMDFTSENATLNDEILEHTDLFSNHIQQQLQAAGATYGIGGYNEHRTIYKRSSLFNGTSAADRRLHLGIDIWGKEGTPVFAALGGMVHSFAFNDHYGDYGATIILLHQLDGFPFYSLYGHLSLADFAGLKEGIYISRGTEFAHFGTPAENGHWPPHLHFQLIIDMEMNKGDYPGVCSLEERDKYLNNCPDPDLVLQMMSYAQKHWD